MRDRLDQIRPEIESVLAALCEYWANNDLQSIRKLWDPDDETPLYQPEEVEQVLTSWEAIREYWRFTAARCRRFQMRLWDLRLKPLGDDYVIAWYRMHWNGQIEGYSEPIGGENRVCATLRRTTDGWRFCQLIEAPVAPLLYMKWLYQKAADPEFREQR